MAGIRFGSRADQLTDGDGDVAAGAKVYFYESGTSDFATTYSDPGLDPGDANPNPVVYNADGRQPYDIFFDPAVDYRVVYHDANDATLAPDDDPAGGNDVTSAITAHNNDLSAHYAASESQRGFVELASQSEVNTGTDTARAVTPAGLANRTATETRAGVVELATPAEVTTGTDSTRAVTPAGLAAAQTASFASAAETLTGTSTTKAITPGGFAGNKTLAASGFYKLPGGLILQWGSGSSSQDASQNFTFPTAFATACYGVGVFRLGDNILVPLFASASTPPTTTQFTINRDSSISDSVPFFYVAVGS
jgi:hypothetical protein